MQPLSNIQQSNNTNGSLLQMPQPQNSSSIPNNPNNQNQQSHQQFVPQLQHFEQLCNVLYGNQKGVSSEQRTSVDRELNQFTEKVENLHALKFFLEHSQLSYAQYLSAAGLKQLFIQNWAKIPVEEKVQIKDYLLNHLVMRGPQCDQQVLRMIITLLAKVVKMSWFDHPELQGLIQDLIKFQTLSKEHLRIALTAMHDLIIEMSYVHKVKNLTVNRRISLNFRDTALFQILKVSLELIERFVTEISTQQAFGQIKINQSLPGQLNNADQIQQQDPILADNLHLACQILEKALSFDFTAILLNETLDDPATTNIPSSWRVFIEDPKNTQMLFRILEQTNLTLDIKIKAAQSLAHLANCRHTLFESTENRVQFVSNFAQMLTQFFQQNTVNQNIFKERTLYKEFVPIVIKFQNNFQVRDLNKAGDATLEGYLSELFNFTIQSYKMQNVSIKFHASKLNHLWNRVYFEGMALSVSCQDRLDDIIKELVRAYLDENLRQKALKFEQINRQSNGDDQLSEEGEDEDENFERGQRTQRQDDLDWFSKLMRQKMEDSLNLLIDRFGQLLNQYEISLQQNQTQAIKAVEHQLAFMIRVTSSLFSYGLPAALTKLHQTFKKEEEFNSMSEGGGADSSTNQQPQPPKFPDFQLISKILNLAKLTNQVRQGGQTGRCPSTELESALLSFAVLFKNYVLTDSRLILLGSSLAKEATENDPVLCNSMDSLYNESKSAYHYLANLAGQNSMLDILEIFLQKIIQNLMTSAGSQKREDSRIVDISLEVFASYLNNAVACRQIAQLDVVKQLATAHVTQFSILQGPSQHKQLGQFFRVLSTLWVSEEFIENFQEYLEQLRPKLEEVFSLDSNQLKQTPGAREEVIKMFYILRGVLRGLQNSKTFNLFFDWFYPQYFQIIIEGALNAFYEDDDVIIVVFKFLSELVLNRNNRVRFDTWNINGLIVFKETAKYVVQLLQIWNCLEKKQIKRSGDEYKEKWKLVKMISGLYYNMIAGHYVNFAICEYYNDNIFTVLSQLVIQMIAACDYEQLVTYERVNSQVFTVLNHFFNNHLELMFLKFDHDLIEKICLQVTRGISAVQFEIQSDSCNCINYVNEFVFQRLKQRQTPKHAVLGQQVQKFYEAKGQHVFQTFLRCTLNAVLFEDNRNMWIFQKVLHSSMIICGQMQDSAMQRVVMELVEQNETNQERKNNLLQHISSLMQAAPLTSLDTKSRDKFGAKYNELKAFVFSL